MRYHRLSAEDFVIAGLRRCTRRRAGADWLESSSASASLTDSMRFFPNPTLRRCLLLCLPALIIGAALRISVLVALPEAYYGSDSNSYFKTTAALWIEGKLDFPAKRRWIYPLMLVPMPLLPGRTLQIIAVTQHALGLATVFGIGWIVLHLTARPEVWVPLVTTLAAIWPRMLWHEHEVIAEVLLLATVVLAAALAFPVGALRDRQRLFWFLIATTAIVAVKPHGKPIWLGLMLAATLIAGAPWHWGKKNLIAAAASVVVMLSGGSSSQGAWLLLSSTLPLVKTEGEKWAEYRQILRPHIEASRADLSQYPWAQARYKKLLSRGKDGLGDDWAKLFANSEKFSHVARDLAFEGIRNAPLDFARLTVLKIAKTLADDDAGARLVPEKFWEQQEVNNEKRWRDRPAEMKLIYELDRAGYDALVAERQERHVWYEPYLLRFTQTFLWAKEIDREVNWVRPAWLGVLAFFGFLTCFLHSRFKATSPLWLPLLLYMGIIFAIGDGVSRYLQPIEWMGMIFIALGVDWLLQLFASGRREPAEIAPEAPPAEPHLS